MNLSKIKNRFTGITFCCFIPFLFFLSSPLLTNAQLNRYLVRFTDKNNTPYSLQRPSEFLSEKAITRRSKHQIPFDSLDLPVNPQYIESVRSIANVSILNTSKWLNSISILTTDLNALATIRSLPFVIEAYAIASRNPSLSSKKFPPPYRPIPAYIPNRTSDFYNYGMSDPQIQMHRIPFLHNLGFRGDSMHVAMIDAGFYRYDEFATFDSVRINGQILDTWDFVDRENSVSEDDAHGMQCFSIMASNLPGTFVGSSPRANYYLYRSEDIFSEYPIEELNLACAAERADSAGVDICSISLGYSTFSDPSFNYTYEYLTGNKCISTRAAQIGSNKGMLFVLAAGNEGNATWHYLTAPADAKDALAVGAVNGSGIPAGFSSYGPTFDGRIKPNVASYGSGTTIANTSNGQPTYGSGTSFACPNMAGVTTCLWQAFKEKNNSDIIQALQKSSSKTNSPDDRVGYGIPDAQKAFIHLQKSGFTHSEHFQNCQTEISCNIKMSSSMHFIIERKYPGETNYSMIADLTSSDTWGLKELHFNDQLLNNTSQVNYRYSMKIANDTTYFIDSATVYFLNPCTPIPPVVNNIGQIMLSPNPAGNILSAFFNPGHAISGNWKIFNEKGQLLATKSTSIPADGGTTTFDINHFSAGTYFIRLTTDEKKVYSARFIKQ